MKGLNLPFRGSCCAGYVPHNCDERNYETDEASNRRNFGCEGEISTYAKPKRILRE